MARRDRSRRSARRDSLRQFFATEAAGGVVLLVATIVALVWANSPARDSYAELWSTSFGVDDVTLTLRGWVNEGLMAVFFFVVGLEIRREVVEGELRTRRQLALPVFAAIGGMLVPALIYVAIAPDAVDGAWGIPMATDIAFALGIAAVVAPRLPSGLRLFLLTLAIVDDIGAILVIALVYTREVGWAWLGAAAVVVLGMVALRRVGRLPRVGFAVLGVVLWLTLHAAGVHATVAGVVVALLLPSGPAGGGRLARTEQVLHPWSSYLVVPVFALANAGVVLSASSLTDAGSSRIAWAIVVGSVVGKVVGISGFAWLAVRRGLAQLPGSARMRDLVCVSTLGGIGFTVSLLIADVGVTGEPAATQARLAVLLGTAIASAVAATALATAGLSRAAPERPG